MLATRKRSTGLHLNSYEAGDEEIGFSVHVKRDEADEAADEEIVFSICVGRRV